MRVGQSVNEGQEVPYTIDSTYPIMEEVRECKVWSLQINLTTMQHSCRIKLQMTELRN